MEPETKLNVVFIGNPGTGKSTLLNGILGEVKFKSGVSLGSGLTTICQKQIDDEGNIFIDTPGLDDIEMRELAAQEIKTALTNGGVFKIFFVITLEAGRVRPVDKATIKVVLECATAIKSNYSIIVNKVEERVFKLLEDKEAKKKFIVTLTKDLPPTTAVYFNQFDAELLGKDNVFPTILPQFYDFIFKSPSVVIIPREVKDINMKHFDYQLGQFGKTLELLQKQTEEGRKAMELAMIEQRNQYKMALDESRRSNEELQKQMGELNNKFHIQLNKVSKVHRPPKNRSLLGMLGDALGELFGI